MKSLNEVLNNEQNNYILPFFWQHGETEEILRDYMEKISEAGMKAVCIESRPHPDFLGETWWRDMDIILDEAKKRNMKVWILDDSHFPTGYANGAVKDAEDRLKKWHLMCKTIDVRGPLKRNRFPVATDLGITLTPDFQVKFSKEELLAVIADSRTDANENKTNGDFQDITHLVSEEGYLYWDVPEGIHRIYIITQKLDACVCKNDYVNFLEKDSVKLLINEVYEAHYQHYKEEFGETIAGFFSDEPGFYNCPGMEYDYDLKLGRRDMPLPWSESLLDQLSLRTGMDIKKYLPCLWFEAGEMTSKLRFEYMQLVTDLYCENFSEQLGEWCEKRNVEYIGHVIEDGNAHSRLGPGAGHYFKAMAGQHMSGIDVVLQQLVPGNDFGRSYFVSGNDLTDGEFYHYGLGKLGASAAHINLKTNGRCMCELYGAYGWSEGISLMKWLADHMLVRGVNWFVPHAFSPKEFPDMDCPPHFYARGNNPQYKFLKELFPYINRMSHLLNNGKSTAKTAVLYHGESDWVGDTLTFQKIGRELMQSQIDFDVVPMAAVQGAKISKNHFSIGNGRYEYLLVPGCDKIPETYIDTLQNLKRDGIQIAFVERRPEVFGQRSKKSREAADISVVSLAQVSKLSRKVIEVNPEEHNLRFYQYEREDGTVYMFLNENQTKEIDCDVSLLEYRGKLYRYDCLKNQIFEVPVKEDGRTFHLHLAKWESMVFVSGEMEDMEAVQCVTASSTQVFQPNCSYKLSLKSYEKESDWEEEGTVSKLEDLSIVYPGFSGTARYETEICLETNQYTTKSILDIGECYEAVELYVNDRFAGSRICAPYYFEAGDLLKEGKNKIRIEVTTTLFEAMKKQDLCSKFGFMEPGGFFGPLIVRY